jgi:hypothetical protein
MAQMSAGIDATFTTFTSSMIDHRGCILALVLGPACALHAQSPDQLPAHDVVIIREEVSWTVTSDRLTLHRHAIELERAHPAGRWPTVITLPLAEGGRPDSVQVRYRDAGGAVHALTPQHWHLAETLLPDFVPDRLVVEPPQDVDVHTVSIAITNEHWGQPYAEMAALHGPNPIRHKRITLSFAPGLFPGVTTFNDLPPAELDPTGASTLGGGNTGPIRRMDTYRWSATDLAPWPASDLVLQHTCLPYLRFNYTLPDARTMLFTVQRDFDRRYPHLTVSTGRHAHALLRFVEAVRARHPRGDLRGTVADVARFVADSVRIVPDSTLVQGEAIGTYFQRRRMSREKVVALYRSLFTILEVPFHVGQARSALLPLSDTAMFAWGEGTHELLGFTAEDGSFHIIVPPDATGSWWMDEAPACIAGTPARFFRFAPGLLHPTEELVTTVPARGAHRIAHRASLTCTKDGAVRIDPYSVLLTGMPATVLHGIGPQVQEPDRLHQALAALLGMDVLKQAERTTGAAADGSRTVQVSLPSETRPGSTQPLTLRHFLPTVFPTALPDAGACSWFLPFACAVRADIQLHAADSSAYSPVIHPPMEHANSVGRFTSTMELTAPGTAVAHLVLELNGGVHGPTERPLLDELLRHAHERLARTPFIRR